MATFCARGRFKPILRRNSHVTVVLRARFVTRKEGKLWVVKFIQLACVLGSTRAGRAAGLPKVHSTGNSFTRICHPQPVTGNHSKGGAAKDTDVRKLRKDLPDTIKNGKAGISRGSRALSRQDPVAIHTAKPGILIGRKGEGVKKIRHALETLVGKKVDLDIKEILPGYRRGACCP